MSRKHQMAPTYFFPDLGIDFALKDAFLLHDFDGKDPPRVPVDGPLDSAHGEAESKQPIHNRSGASMRDGAHNEPRRNTMVNQTAPQGLAFTQSSPSHPERDRHPPRACQTSRRPGRRVPLADRWRPPLHRRRATSCPLYPSPRRRSRTSCGSGSSARPTSPPALAPMRRRRHPHGPSRR